MLNRRTWRSRSPSQTTRHRRFAVLSTTRASSHPMLSRCRSLRIPPLSAISKGVASPARRISGGKSAPFSLPCPPRRSDSPELVGYTARWASEMAGVGGGSVHDFTVKDVKGKDVNLSAYKGKVLLIVNVASQCGLTGTNYMELNQLHGKYKDQGLEILVFPCNQFGGEEPGTNEQILDFACTRYQVQYPIFAKVDVNGDNAAPLYKYLKASKKGIFGKNIKWNFSKFLIDKNGHVVDRFAPTTSPLSIEEDIKKLLKAV